VAEHGDELVAKIADFPLMGQRRLGLLVAVVVFQLQRHYPGEGFHHRLDGALPQVGRARVEGANRAEKAAVGAEQRHRDVAFELVQARGVVVAVLRVGAGLVDDDGLVVAVDLVAQGGGQVQLAAHAQAKAQVVAHCAGGPMAVGDPRHGGEAHAGALADHLQDGGHGLDAADGGDVGGKGIRHGGSTDR